MQSKEFCMTAAAPMIGLLTACEDSLAVAEKMGAAIHDNLVKMLMRSGKVDADLLTEHQFSAHGYAWICTYLEALARFLQWAKRLEATGKFGLLEQWMLQSGFGEYLNQLYCGIHMSQTEIVRPADLGVDHVLQDALRSPATVVLRRTGNTELSRRQIAAHIKDEGRFGALGLEDPSLELVRDQFRRFTAEHVTPVAHEWHLKDELIPLPVISAMSELGVFGLTIPEEYGGLGLSKTAMCVVTEELSRAYIGVGSLGTRSEIAAELIRLGGTEEQKRLYLPKLASGEIIPTAVFTEPTSGSDLGSLRTRAQRDGQRYLVTGNKVWITHAARSDLMTLMVRTDPASKDWRGLSMFLAEKPRGTESDPFPVEGITGGEIRVLGYRGMKEYEMAFDNFSVPADKLLGGSEGQGFKQLMATFESARIQTAARAVGVAQNALETGLSYALERSQFGKPLFEFPRVFGKLAWMTVETMISRQLTYSAAGERDHDRRCDIEAGMAKLLAARVAWGNADNALQIHGGNGYAEEFPISRILCDARILSIFEGSAEIQAQIIARGLLARGEDVT
jgi:(2S)-methylsuccinyl-CoA dehydrogenase